MTENKRGNKRENIKLYKTVSYVFINGRQQLQSVMNFGTLFPLRDS